jgi:hypothetical protein
MADAVTDDYRSLIAEAASVARPAPRRTMARLRRELREIRARDLFPQPIASEAKRLVEELADATEAAS